MTPEFIVVDGLRVRPEGIGSYPVCAAEFVVIDDLRIRLSSIEDYQLGENGDSLIINRQFHWIDNAEETLDKLDNHFGVIK